MCEAKMDIEQDLFSADTKVRVPVAKRETVLEFPGPYFMDAFIPASQIYDINERLVEAVASANKSAADDIFADFFAKRTACAPPEYRLMQFYLLTFISAIYNSLYACQSSCIKMLPRESDICALLLRASTPTQARDLVEAFIDEVFSIQTKYPVHDSAALVSLSKSYIEKNYRLDITAESLGNMLYISSSHMRSIFKSETGYTVQQYTEKVRMKNAVLLLTNTNQPVQNIAEEVGYRSIQTFFRVFKKIYGVTPGEYRKSA